ncbi:hypothetical protein OG21DRAFT_1491063 [Imleria badia]|nr:hypothetical protein OG21DRAFT_1491063 [Imleria badia]
MTASTVTKHREPATDIDIDIGSWVNAVTFSADNVWTGGDSGARVWQAEEGKQGAIIGASAVQCLAASKDGRWIAAGTYQGEMFVWDAETHEQVFWHRDNSQDINGVDFSPDSTRLVFASDDWSATVWDIATCKQVQTLHHEHWVRAAKYSPQGKRIATATGNSVRVWDSNDGHLLVETRVKVTQCYNTGLLWCNDHLFVISDSKIIQIEASTGSAVSEWPVSDGDMYSCIALPNHGEFIAYSAARTVSFWDTTTHTHLGLIQHSQNIRSIAVSPDDRFLAIGGEDWKIVIESLSRITDAIPLSRLHPTFQEPDIQINDAALYSWKHNQLKNAGALLTAAIPTSRYPTHHLLASRALVRARLQEWDTAIVDATESIKIQPSVIGYIAASVALVSKGEKHNAYRACDIASERFHSTHVTFLLLIKAIIVFMAGEHDDAISRIDDLINTVHFNSICYVVQARVHVPSPWKLAHGEWRLRECDTIVGACASPNTIPYESSSLGGLSGWKFDDLDFTIHQRRCEALHAAGRIKEAGESLLSMLNTIDERIYGTEPVVTWVSDFSQRCLSTPDSTGDATFHSPSPTPLLREWAKLKLTGGSWNDALVGALSFTVPRFTIYRALCDHLETLDQLTVAMECFHQMNSELTEQTNLHAEQEWVLHFRQRVSTKFECRGDNAMNVRKYDTAISEYSSALSLDPAASFGLFIKRSKAYVALSLWEEASNDADKVTTFYASSPWGYKRKHAALHGAGRYEDAIRVFETMLSKISHSPDPAIRDRHREYVNPKQTKEAIRAAIKNAIRESPLMLINTDCGRLLDKSGQACSFESQPIFRELISSMTTHIDHARIEREVAEYFRYATFSHKWKENEPLFEKVIRVVVYELEESLTHNKLQMFCKIVREAGFHWAWSDTCCINKADHFELQEALVSMFKWYRGSAATIVLLCGVRSPSKRGELVRSIWNTRAWTFQEYHASKVVRFYTEDWKPYLNLDISNHKESPEIIAEMEEATGVSAQALLALRPGLQDIREKLRLAATRQTTRVEDAAYSLLGIFSMSLPVVYGEGDKALGRFLSQLLTSSGDTSILSWTGQSGSFNSCLPADIAVFNHLPTMHIPPTLERAEMERITASLRNASLNWTSIMRLHSLLLQLPVASFAGQRMKLPCLTFKLGPLSAYRSTSGRVFRAQTDALGIVEIRTEEDLLRFGSLYLVHPWIDFLLGQQPVGSVAETIPEENADAALIDELPSLPGAFGVPSVAPQTTGGWITSLWWPFGEPCTTISRDAASLRPTLSVSRTEMQKQALQVIGRLGQPFGALLLTPLRGHVAAYRRVATKTLIAVQIEEITPMILNKLVDSVCTVDVL